MGCYILTNYYNENDPKAAAWLRELIKEGYIANGIVDDRSIKDIQPNDLKDFTQCHFFAGIGGWSYALQTRRVARRPPSLDRLLPLPAFQRRQVKRAAPTTPAIFGRNSIGSLASADLPVSFWRTGCERGRPRVARSCID